MYIDEVSDFHTEMWMTDVNWASAKNAGSRVLIVAGDTSNSSQNTAMVIHEAAKHYEHVVFVDGNHEHYEDGKRFNVLETMDRLTEATQSIAGLKNVTYLRGNNSVLIDDVLFVGACGWYDFTIAEGYTREHQHATWKEGSNDARYIRFAPGLYPDKMAALQTGQIAQIVAEAQHRPEVKRIVVVTHTSPLLRGLRQTGNPGWDAMNGAYGNAQMGQVVEADINGKICLWFFGHTHYRNDFIHEGIRYISAPRGYQGEKHLNWTGPIQIDTEEEPIESAFGALEA